MPASRTMATGARFWPSSSSIVLSNGALACTPASTKTALPRRFVQRGQACALGRHAVEVGGGLGNLAAERLVLHAVDEPADDAVLEPFVAEVRAQRLVDHRAGDAGRAEARVDGARVVVGAAVGLVAAEDPLDGGIEPVEIDVCDDGVDGACVAHDLGRHHLRAGSVLGLGGEREARRRRRSRRGARDRGDRPTRRGGLRARVMNAPVVSANGVPMPSAAKAMSTTATRPRSLRASGRLRGVVKTISGSVASARHAA